jgi:membrane-associated phospholipid phosphatase
VGASTKHRQHGLLFFQRLIVSAWIAFAMFLIFPVEIELRSQAYGAEGVFGWMMTMLHEADTPYNAWPSIHVLLSILVVFFVRFVEMENGTWTTPKAVVIWISCALLIASTALIKQHYVFDGVSGTVLALGLWYGWIRPGLN